MLLLLLFCSRFLFYSAYFTSLSSSASLSYICADFHFLVFLFSILSCDLSPGFCVSSAPLSTLNQPVRAHSSFCCLRSTEMGPDSCFIKTAQGRHLQRLIHPNCVCCSNNLFCLQVKTPVSHLPEAPPTVKVISV